MDEKITKKLADSFGLQLVSEDGTITRLPSLPITIGRVEQNDIQLEDEFVSENHARIYFDNSLQSICIEDIGSLNGIYIDNKPTRKNLLWDGASIRIGTTQFIFRDTGFIPTDQ